VTLLAFAAERNLLLSAVLQRRRQRPPLSIDIDRQTETDAQTDARQFHRPFSACYVSSFNRLPTSMHAYPLNIALNDLNKV